MTDQEERPVLSRDQTHNRLRQGIGWAISVLVVSLAVTLLWKQEAIQTTQRQVNDEVTAQRAPQSLMGTKWRMSKSEIRSPLPDAVERSPESLLFETSCSSRPAFVHFAFSDGPLTIILITFKGEKTENTYRQTIICSFRNIAPSLSPPLQASAT